MHVSKCIVYVWNAFTSVCVGTVNVGMSFYFCSCLFDQWVVCVLHVWNEFTPVLVCIADVWNFVSVLKRTMAIWNASCSVLC